MESEIDFLDGNHPKLKKVHILHRVTLSKGISLNSEGPNPQIEKTKLKDQNSVDWSE